ncbi:MAG: ATP-dependent protease subunit HslV [Bacteroidetes bacterium]|nr:ATP-dependent protease subunit HslV [Bacteroidota bacterium]MCL5026126.1 ATP-dependent protease subunit HslV [Chloroflexota bacterium]
MRGTTILAVCRNGQVAMAGDGQITVGDVVMKRGASKIRTLSDGRVLAGFAGSVADALTLFERFEAQLDRHDGNLRRAAVELAKDWRRDRYLRRLYAWLIVADLTQMLVLSGEGDVIEPDDEVVAIGSGGSYALSAAKALLRHTELSASEIAREAMQIAASLCVYTNDNISLIELGPDEEEKEDGTAEEDE